MFVGIFGSAWALLRLGDNVEANKEGVLINDRYLLLEDLLRMDAFPIIFSVLRLSVYPTSKETCFLWWASLFHSQVSCGTVDHW